jgi:hypothetical protein
MLPKRKGVVPMTSGPAPLLDGACSRIGFRIGVGAAVRLPFGSSVRSVSGISELMVGWVVGEKVGRGVDGVGRRVGLAVGRRVDGVFVGGPVDGFGVGRLVDRVGRWVVGGRVAGLGVGRWVDAAREELDGARECIEGGMVGEIVGSGVLFVLKTGSMVVTCKTGSMVVTCKTGSMVVTCKTGSMVVTCGAAVGHASQESGQFCTMYSRSAGLVH